MASQQTHVAGVLDLAKRTVAFSSSNGRRKMLITVGVVVVVVLIATVLVPGMRRREQGDMRLFKVRPMSFPVVLKEKGEIKAKSNEEIKCEVDGRSTII